MYAKQKRSNCLFFAEEFRPIKKNEDEEEEDAY